MNREASITLLNKAIADELQAVHQYLYFHFHMEDQGLGPLAKLFQKTAIEEMHHVALLAERVLFLKGDVTMQVAGPVERINEPLAMLERAREMEDGSVLDYNKSALEAAKLADAGTKQIFESLVRDEEGHLDRWEKQLENVKRFGPTYLALQSFDGAQENRAGEAS